MDNRKHSAQLFSGIGFIRIKVVSSVGGISMQASCPICGKTVMVFPVFPEAEFWGAINLGKPVEVMHVSDEGDHIWILPEQARENLSKQKSKGML
jgi:hypothetical protein